VELSEVQVSPEASSDVDAYVFELAKKMAQAALEVGRELHVNDSKLLDVLRKRPGCFAYTF
jgi:purine nucleoside permease